ncbi:MAG: hypothetical protein P8179_23805 [Candidatus Thiodiazotropha sp.]
MTGLKIIKSQENDYGYTILPPDGFLIVDQNIDKHSGYLVVTIVNSEYENKNCFILNNNGEVIFWEQRQKELKDNLQIEQFETGFRIERKRIINMKNGSEFYKDILYKNSERLMDQIISAQYIDHYPINDLYVNYIENNQSNNKLDRMGKQEKTLYWLKFSVQSIRAEGTVSIQDMRKSDPDIDSYIDDIVSAYAELLGEGNLNNVKSAYFTD